MPLTVGQVRQAVTRLDVASHARHRPCSRPTLHGPAASATGWQSLSMNRAALQACAPSNTAIAKPRMGCVSVTFFGALRAVGQAAVALGPSRAAAVAGHDAGLGRLGHGAGIGAANKGLLARSHMGIGRPDPLIMHRDMEGVSTQGRPSPFGPQCCHSQAAALPASVIRPSYPSNRPGQPHNLRTRVATPYWGSQGAAGARNRSCVPA